MPENGVDPHYTDRCPQYRSITVVRTAKYIVRVKRRCSSFTMGPEHEVEKKALEAIDAFHDSPRQIAVSICNLKGVYHISIARQGDESGAEFEYLH